MRGGMRKARTLVGSCLLVTMSINRLDSRDLGILEKASCEDARWSLEHVVDDHVADLAG